MRACVRACVCVRVWGAHTHAHTHARTPPHQHPHRHPGNQPLFSHDKLRSCTVNGEIYNHLELKAELKTRGFSDSGPKTALQSRLREAVADPGTAAAPTPPPPPQPDQYWLDPSPASIATRASFGVAGDDMSSDDELMFDVAGDDDDEGAEAFRHAHPRENALAAANRANNAEWAWYIYIYMYIYVYNPSM